MRRCNKCGSSDYKEIKQRDSQRRFECKQYRHTFTSNSEPKGLRSFLSKKKRRAFKYRFLSGYTFRMVDAKLDYQPGATRKWFLDEQVLLQFKMFYVLEMFRKRKFTIIPKDKNREKLLIRARVKRLMTLFPPASQAKQDLGIRERPIFVYDILCGTVEIKGKGELILNSVEDISQYLQNWHLA